jgi:glutamate synthase domain-containing protein 3
VPNHPKANSLNLSRLLHDVAREKDLDLPRLCLENRNDGLHDHPLDDKIIQRAKDAIRDKMPVRLAFDVQNTHRNIGTKLSGEVAFLHGDHGLPEGTITLDLEGSAGQSFGTFLCGGITLRLTGEANDYVGKGMTGGTIVVRPPAKTGFVPSENSILGNTCLYGASGGHLFANGRAGERFAVRNSGVTAVVEGVGDHGCEYMTNGVVVILGPTGKNFGAGMSGGVAYVLDEAGHFPKLANLEMIELVPVEETADVALLKELTYNHLDATDSAKARALLADWPAAQKLFWKVRPKAVNPPAPAAKPQPVAAKV